MIEFVKDIFFCTRDKIALGFLFSEKIGEPTCRYMHIAYGLRWNGFVVHGSNPSIRLFRLLDRLSEDIFTSAIPYIKIPGNSKTGKVHWSEFFSQSETANQRAGIFQKNLSQCWLPDP